MGWLLLVFLALVALVTLMMYGVGRFISAYVQRHISVRLDELDRIVNEELVPETWLKPFRQRASRLIASGAGEDRIRELELTARKQCLTRIEQLRRYATETGVAGTDDTKRMIAETLNEQERLWRDDATWHKLVDFTKPPAVFVIVEPDLYEDMATDSEERAHDRDVD